MPEPVTIFTPSATPPSNPAPAAPQFRSTPASDARQLDGIRSDPVESPAQARYRADFDQLTSEDIWRRQDVVIVKNPDGSLSARPRGNGQQNAPDAGEQPGQPQPQAQPDHGPASVGEDGRLAVGDLRLSADDIKLILAEKSARDSRAANTPADAANYDLTLPEGFEGASAWKWDLEDVTSAASLGALKEYAKSVGLDQGNFSKLLGIYAGHTMREQQRFAEAQRAEIDKLGANAPGRVDAVNTWVRSMVGDQLATSIRKSLFTADQIRAFESLISRWTSQGVSGSPSAGRDPGANKPGQLTDEQYGKLTYTQKLQYAQQFDQRQFQNGG